MVRARLDVNLQKGFQESFGRGLLLQSAEADGRAREGCAGFQAVLPGLRKACEQSPLAAESLPMVESGFDLGRPGRFSIPGFYEVFTASRKNEEKGRPLRGFGSETRDGKRGSWGSRSQLEGEEGKLCIVQEWSSREGFELQLTEDRSE